MFCLLREKNNEGFGLMIQQQVEKATSRLQKIVGNKEKRTNAFLDCTEVRIPSQPVNLFSYNF